METQIDYISLKAAMKNKGYEVSEGEGWGIIDNISYKEFSFFHGSVDPVTSLYGLAYTSLLPAGFPGTPDAPEVIIAESAPIDADNGEGVLALDPLALQNLNTHSEAVVIPVDDTPPADDDVEDALTDTPPVVDTPVTDVEVKDVDTSSIANDAEVKDEENA